MIRKTRMSDIIKYLLIFISTDSILVNAINSTRPSTIGINHLAILDYDFFTYDIVDHNTLLIKFDLSSTGFFRQSNVIYDAHLYMSKTPNINHTIHIGSFSGYYEKEIKGTRIDHFTFCLVLIPITNRTKTIFHKYIKSTNRKQAYQHILHYCTKLGPIDEEHLHSNKHGSKGDHILLILQLVMIGIFLFVIQVAHIVKNRRKKKRIHQYFERLRSEISMKEPSELSHGALQLLRFVTIHEELNENDQETTADEDDDDDEEEEEIKNNFLTVSHRQMPSPRLMRKRSRSPSPTFFGLDDDEPELADSSVKHILESKPWVQIPK